MAFPQNLTVQRDKVTEFCDIAAQPTCGDWRVEPKWLTAAYIMSSNSDRKNQMTSGLHPWVYTALIIFALWFALAVWSFAGPGETDYLLVIVSGFICVVVSLQLLMGRLHRADQAITEGEDKAQTFREWLQASFDTERDRMTGAEAAILILLPIAVAAIGMTAFGIIFQIVEHAGT